ncbi:MAG: AraC family transcriptional regulator [Saprospiraceae bacterium]|nr:AraC family transcriptional regulator [Saprospiraceae bacterium]
MELIYDQAQGKVDVPHRHDYYTVIIVEEAKGQHLIDYKSYDFSPLQVHFVSPGQVHQVVTSARPKGSVFTFSQDFLIENNIPERFISNINLFRQFGESPPLLIDETTFARLSRILVEMEECLPLDLHYRSRALGALLQLFLIYCNNSCLLDTTQLDEENNGVCMLRDFKDLVNQNFAKWHKVAQYAPTLHITPKHLSHTLKSLTGKTAKEIIQDRLVLEAKRLLFHTNLTIKEIAYRLGYEEPLHFSSFFKKQAGESPSQYRQARH